MSRQSSLIPGEFILYLHVHGGQFIRIKTEEPKSHHPGNPSNTVDPIHEIIEIRRARDEDRQRQKEENSGQWGVVSGQWSKDGSH